MHYKVTDNPKGVPEEEFDEYIRPEMNLILSAKKCRGLTL